MPFVATQIYLEIVTLSEGSQTEEDKYMIDITYMWTHKKGTDEVIYKVETESQMQKKNLWSRGVGGVMNWKTGIAIYTQLYVGG